jgi:hypothetical protein
LRKIYEKNYSRYSQQLHNPQSGLLKLDGTLKNLTISAFLSRFVFVHGLFFYLALSEAHVSASTPPPTSLPKYDVNLTADRATELARDQLSSVLEDLERLLRLRQMKGDVLLQMIAVCLFSLHFSGDAIADCSCSGEGGAEEGGAGAESWSEGRARTTKESLSLLMLYGMINK